MKISSERLKTIFFIPSKRGLKRIFYIIFRKSSIGKQFWKFKNKLSLSLHKILYEIELIYVAKKFGIFIINYYDTCDNKDFTIKEFCVFLVTKTLKTMFVETIEYRRIRELARFWRVHVLKACWNFFISHCWKSSFNVNLPVREPVILHFPRKTYYLY